MSITVLYLITHELSEDSKINIEKYKTIFYATNFQMLSDESCMARLMTRNWFKTTYGINVDISSSLSGKPVVCGEWEGQISIAHADDMVVVSICEDRYIGVDVENHSQVVTDKHLDLLGIGIDLKLEDKLAEWTKFESWCKLHGRGLCDEDAKNYSSGDHLFYHTTRHEHLITVCSSSKSLIDVHQISSL